MIMAWCIEKHAAVGIIVEVSDVRFVFNRSKVTSWILSNVKIF
jgi:hypothetical protein